MSLYSEKDLEFASAVNLEYHGETPTLVRLHNAETGKMDDQKTEVKKGDVLTVHESQARQLLRQYGHLFTLEGDKPLKQPQLHEKKAKAGSASKEQYDEKGNRLFSEAEVRAFGISQVKAALKGWDKKFNRHASLGELQDLLIEHIGNVSGITDAELTKNPSPSTLTVDDFNDEVIDGMKVPELKEALATHFPDVVFKAQTKSEELKALLRSAVAKAVQNSEPVEGTNDGDHVTDESNTQETA